MDLNLEKGSIRDGNQYTYMQISLERKSVELFFSCTHLQDLMQYHNFKGVLKGQLEKTGDGS